MKYKTCAFISSAEMTEEQIAVAAEAGFRLEWAEGMTVSDVLTKPLGREEDCYDESDWYYYYAEAIAVIEPVSYDMITSGLDLLVFSAEGKELELLVFSGDGRKYQEKTQEPISCEGCGRPHHPGTDCH